MSRSEIWLELCELVMKECGWTDCKPSPTAHHWYHSVSETLRNTAKTRVSSPQTQKDRFVVLQLHINCTTTDYFITNTSEKSSDVFVTAVNRTAFVSPRKKKCKLQSFLVSCDQVIFPDQCA